MQGWSLVTDDRRWIIDFFKYVHRQTSREGVLHDFRASLICKKSLPGPHSNWMDNQWLQIKIGVNSWSREVCIFDFIQFCFYHLNGWILLNVKTMPKILRFLKTLKLLLSNVRFSPTFRRIHPIEKMADNRFISRSYRLD